MNNTKIVATIGPSSSDIETIKQLFCAGMNVVRINMSYADHDFCLDIIKKVEKINKEYSKKIAIMLDTAGPEVQVGKFENGQAFLTKGDKIRIYTNDVLGDKTKFSVNYENLVEDVKINDIIKINDGKISLEIIDKGTNYILCTVINEGIISDNNGLNIPGRKLNIPFLSKKDKEDIEFACTHKIDFLALSYVSSFDDIALVNDMLIEHGNDHLEVISKIENETGYENIDEIIKLSDGIMVARGDLGVEVPIERVPLIQKSIISKCHQTGKISIVSTEFLSSMKEELMPTRAEVSDVANAVLDGADVVLLSGETTVGKHPVETLQIMEKIISVTEAGMPNTSSLNSEEEQDITGFVSYSVALCANKLGCKAIVTPTMSGYTAKKLSSFRPKCPIISLSPDEEVVKSLTLHYGVHPVIIPKVKEFDEILDVAKECTKSLMKVEENDKIVVTGGYPFSKVKHTNFMKIEEL